MSSDADQEEKKKGLKNGLSELETAINDSKNSMLNNYKSYKEKVDFDPESKASFEQKRIIEQIRIYWTDFKDQEKENKNELFQANYISKLIQTKNSIDHWELGRLNPFTKEDLEFLERVVLQDESLVLEKRSEVWLRTFSVFLPDFHTIEGPGHFPKLVRREFHF